MRVSLGNYIIDTRMPAAEHPRPAKAQAKRRDDGRVSPGTFFGFAAK